MKLILAFSSISSLVSVASASPLDIPPIKKVGAWQYNCDATSVSDMPWNVFQVVAQNFCKEANEGPEVFELTLDSQGFRKLDVDKRTPPPNLGAYFDYGVLLRKNGSSNIESEGCTQAYNLLQMSECGHASGQSNNMLAAGWASAGNVTYTYRIGKKYTF